VANKNAQCVPVKLTNKDIWIPAVENRQEAIVALSFILFAMAEERFSIKFVVFTHAGLYWEDGKWWGYAPYVREMNIWLRFVESAVFVCPVVSPADESLPAPIECSCPVKVIPLRDFNLHSARSLIQAIPRVISNFIIMVQQMRQADHIHLRVPGNMGLIGCVAQIFFPAKRKTAKYAGNWDPASRQPWSYKWQRKLLNNTNISKNIRVLVYGEWPNASSNAVPFFTATYSEKDFHPTRPRELAQPIQLIFVGSLVLGKRPKLAMEAIQVLNELGVTAQLHVFGQGAMFAELQQYLRAHRLESQVFLHGSVPAEELRHWYGRCHFLVFVSRSEGWPKVVAESMAWGCLPITSAVSCVPQMVGYGRRGTLVEPEATKVADAVVKWMGREGDYLQACEEGMQWSRQFTLEKFAIEIRRFLMPH